MLHRPAAQLRKPQGPGRSEVWVRCRSPHLAPQALMPDMRTPMAACSPHYAQAGLPPLAPMGQPGSMLHGTPAPVPQPVFGGEAPSTDELLRAAHGGSYYHPGEP